MSVMRSIKISKAGSGFTLIELAVVIIIAGLLIASLSPLATLYVKNKRIQTTQSNISGAVSAIGAYLLVNGHYPCPAPIIADKTDPQYGHAGDCSDSTTVAVGSCVGGICIERGLGTAIHDPVNPSSMITVTPRVRIGTVPFRELNLPDESYTKDGYDSYLVYAVTESLAAPTGFNAEAGGISILNEQNASAISPDNSAHFVVLSTGPNKAGAYLPNGDKSADCPAAGLENVNCAPGTDAVFRVAQQNDSSTVSKFDDVVSYSLETDMPLWELSQANDNNIHHKTSGGIGVSEDPDLNLLNNDKGSVKKEMRAQQNLMTQQVCDTDGSCFPTSVIAGDLDNKEGLKCDPDPVTGQPRYMVGISHNAPECRSLVSVKCPDGQFLVGFDQNKEAICKVPDSPPKNCDAMVVQFCTNPTLSGNLPAAAHGESAQVSGGASFVQNYICDDGTWVATNSSGSCKCTPKTQTDNSQTCAAGMTGAIARHRTFECPAGAWTAWVIDSNTCACDPTTQERPKKCPANQTGSITQQRTNSCPENKWSAWTDISNTCACTPKTETRPLACTGGLTGTQTQQRELQCPSGNYTNWTTVSGSCTCNSKTETRTVSCATGYTGDITQERTFSCPSAQWSGWTEVSDTCVAIPPAVCAWTTLGAGDVPSDFHIGPKSGSNCTCGATDGPCYRATGGNKFVNFAACKCGN